MNYPNITVNSGGKSISLGIGSVVHDAQLWWWFPVSFAQAGANILMYLF